MFGQSGVRQFCRISLWRGTVGLRLGRSECVDVAFVAADRFGGTDAASKRRQYSRSLF